MTKIDKEKVFMNSNEIKHDLCMLFHAIEDEYGFKHLCNLIIECLEILEKFHHSKVGKNEEKSKVKIHKKPKVKEYEIKADNIEEALKQLEELDLPEEVKKLARESLKN